MCRQTAQSACAVEVMTVAAEELKAKLLALAAPVLEVDVDKLGIDRAA